MAQPYAHASASELGREYAVNALHEFIKNFETRSRGDEDEFLTKRGLYVYGSSGVGKTEFVTKTLESLNYDVIRYDSSQVRNKKFMESLTKQNMGTMTIMAAFKKTGKKIAIVMDDINEMNSSDKGGITTLIKMVRAKKNKKQKDEYTTSNPIICIGNNQVDKNIKELMKVCDVIELRPPTPLQMRAIAAKLYPQMSEKMVEVAGLNLNKLQLLSKTIASSDSNIDALCRNCRCDDSTTFTKNLLNGEYANQDQFAAINNSDRTIVALLWHENVIDLITNSRHCATIRAVELYRKMLGNICFADYIDRITFQRQIWQFNEITSIIKTFKNNHIFLEATETSTKKIENVRFTKVLTKYSTEYNNSLFINELCQKLGYNKSDLYTFFEYLKTTEARATAGAKEVIETSEAKFLKRIEHDSSDTLVGFSDFKATQSFLDEEYEITSLDIKRMFRYLAKYTEPIIELSGSSKSDDLDELLVTDDIWTE